MCFVGLSESSSLKRPHQLFLFDPLCKSAETLTADMSSEAAEVTTAVGQLSLPQQRVSASVISCLSRMAVILKSMRYEINLT